MLRRQSRSLFPREIHAAPPSSSSALPRTFLSPSLLFVFFSFNFSLPSPSTYYSSISLSSVCSFCFGGKRPFAARRIINSSIQSGSQPICCLRAPSSTPSPAPTPLGKSFLCRPIRLAIGNLQQASSGRDLPTPPTQATGAYPKHSPCPSLTLPAVR